VRALSAVEEVTLEGTITARPVRPPNGRWPVAAIDDGLLFQGESKLDLWDPATESFLAQLPGPFPAATWGNRVVSCVECDELYLIDRDADTQRTVLPPDGVAGFLKLDCQPTCTPVSSAAMGRLETRPFTDEFLAPAGELLAARHREHRGAEPLLPARYERAAAATKEVAVQWRTEGASGAVGIRDGRLVAYLLGAPKDESRWGPNVWVESAGHASEDPEDLRDIYATAAGRWFEEGRVRQYALVPASATGHVSAWFRLSFGLQHAIGVRELPEVPWPDGVRSAELRDVDALVDLSPLLSEHQAQPPVFGIGLPRETAAEIRAEILEDMANNEIGDLVAEQNGRVVGAFQNVPVELSSMHTSLARPEGAVLLSWAATRPEVRGSGAGIALTQATFAWAREHGYTTIVTDWRVTNLISSRFWPARGFRETFLRLYRHIP